VGESDESPDITEWLRDWRSGSEEALERLMPVVYEALRTIASRHMARERRDGTLATTALVHEAYLRLVKQRDVDWQNRAHFFAIAARLMRRIVVDEARRRRRVKRGSGVMPVHLEAAGDLSVADSTLEMPDVLALDRALAELEAMDPDQGRVVELKFFGGLTVDEIATVMKTSTRTVKREWAVARAWLYRALQEGGASQGRGASSAPPRAR
jgi:RNA polymerase sigma factor (TIGR02999 family)